MSKLFGIFSILLAIPDSVRSSSIPFEKINDTSACRNDADCVFNGRCVSLDDGQLGKSTGGPGICYCSRSCDSSVPFECSKSRQCQSGNVCDKEQKLCICKSSANESCAKRNLDIIFFNVTRDTPYVGEHITVQCCTNIDPRSVKLRWLHNMTVELRSTETPDQFTKCWKLVINNVQYKDSGQYTCQVYADGQTQLIKKSLPVQVRGSKILAKVLDAVVVANQVDDNNGEGSSLSSGTMLADNPPITLSLTAVPLNGTSIAATWLVKPLAHLGVSIKVETLDRRTVFDKRNLMEENSVVITKLKPGTWYHVIAETVPFKDNRTAMEKISIQTNESLPGLPQLSELRILDRMKRTKCTVSWRPPLQPNGRVLYYQLEMKGLVRRNPKDNNLLVADHRPNSSTCADLRRIPADSQFMFCEFVSLLPNRNYTASVVAVNSAGKSELATFPGVCATGFEAPLHLDAPTARRNGDDRSLTISFGENVDELSGPINMYARCNSTSDPNCSFQRRVLEPGCSPQTLHLLNQIFFYYCIVITIIGLLGNGAGLALLLWAKFKLRRYSMNIFLIAVYFCDLAILLSLALQLARVGKLNVQWLPGFCQLSMYTTNVFTFISQWSMWAMSFERYLAICRPMFLINVNSGRNTMKLMVFFVFAAFTLESWTFFVVKTDDYDRCTTRLSHLLFDRLNLLESAISYVTPGAMIVGFTSGTFRGLIQHEHRFKEFDPTMMTTPSHQQTRAGVPGDIRRGESYAVISTKASRRLHRREKQTAWFLISVVLIDTLLNLQNYGIRLYSSFSQSKRLWCVEFRTVRMVSFMLYYLQYALNVFYLLICPRGRYFVKRKHSYGVSSSDITKKRSFDMHQGLKGCNSL